MPEAWRCCAGNLQNGHTAECRLTQLEKAYKGSASERDDKARFIDRQLQREKIEREAEKRVRFIDESGNVTNLQINESPPLETKRIDHLRKIRILMHNAWTEAKLIGPVVEDDREMVNDFHEIIMWLDMEIHDESSRT